MSSSEEDNVDVVEVTKKKRLQNPVLKCLYCGQKISKMAKKLDDHIVICEKFVEYLQGIQQQIQLPDELVVSLE